MAFILLMGHKYQPIPAGTPGQDLPERVTINLTWRCKKGDLLIISCYLTLTELNTARYNYKCHYYFSK